jgi:imidazole glycerol-phosphate synthase subunit HisH
MREKKATVAIVDYSLGNLHSIQRACQHAGLEAVITTDKKDLLTAEAVILPGVGAFGDAMANLRRLDLVEVLRDTAASHQILIGICLGLQLLMKESAEFGNHKGLGIFEGQVIRFDQPREGTRLLKVPQIGWNGIFSPNGNSWKDSLLEGIPDGQDMYFVHSYIVQPEDPSLILSSSRFGHIDFCSSVQRENIFACQYHPERSGPAGLKIYHNLKTSLDQKTSSNEVGQALSPFKGDIYYGEGQDIGSATAHFTVGN